MKYEFLCNDCSNRFEGFRVRQCPRCGGKNLVLLKPSREVGLLILFVGVLMAVSTVVGVISGNLLFYSNKLVTVVIAAIGVFLSSFGGSITFVRRQPRNAR